MKVILENGKLSAVNQYLYGLNLTRKHSRFRRRLIDKINERLKVVEEDRKALLEEHANKDPEGKAIILENGNYDIRDMVAFSNDIKELNTETLVIEGGDNREMIRTIQQVLRKFEDVEYEGQDSEIYDYLCDQFAIEEEVKTEGDDK